MERRGGRRRFSDRVRYVLKMNCYHGNQVSSHVCCYIASSTRNSSADERANVNFLYDYIVRALGIADDRLRQRVM